MIIATILEVATGLFSMIAAVKTVKENFSNTEQVEKIAETFRRIADTLDRVVTELKNNEVPHGACQELAHYASVLPTITAGALESNQVNYYSSRLIDAHNVEQLLMTLTDNKNEQLAELQKAAGVFRASSYTIVI